MPPILLHLVPASIYAALGAHFWRTRWLDPAPARRNGLSLTERLVILFALATHGYVLHGALFPGGGMHFGFGVALSLMLWLAVLFYWIEALYTRLDGLQTLAMPIAAISCLLPALFPGHHILDNSGTPAFRVHFIIAMLAYSLFTLAAFHALLMSAAEKRLHDGRLNRALANLPPLLTMEALLFRLVSIAFILLTLTLVSGIGFSEVLFGRPARFDHKTVFGFASWGIFATLLVGRHFWGWRGRPALRWILAGFVALLLAYVGTRFVTEILLARPA
ncbi:MAG: cytochrome c biogenesis protein CcsA [Zoogloeaceae bacterium]|nr:cytochrome c biogenesis protein CcsA [Zoogloeaceae bacterium]